jgi:hypothetical protein
MIYDNMTDLGQRLSRIEAQVEGIREDLRVFTDVQRVQAEKIEAVEKKMYYGHGILGTLIFFITMFGDYVRSIISGK